MHLSSQTYHIVMDILRLGVMVSFIHGVTLVLSTDATVNTFCLESNNKYPTVRLTCGSKKRIHVISERYGNSTNEQCGQNTSNIYDISSTNNEDGLIVNCNGKQNTTCHEALFGSVSCKPVCAFEIKHECVEDSMSLCRAVNTKSQNEIVYLHSPGFPDPDKEDNNCSCRITGPMMTVTVVEYRPGDGAVSIFPDSKPVFPSAFTLYNRVIATDVSTVVVNYEDKTGSMWIKFAGTGPLNIVCMEVSNITSSKITTATQATTKDLTSNSESTSNPVYSVVTMDAVTPSTSTDRTTRVTTDAANGTLDTVTPSTSNDSTEEEVTEAASNTSDAVGKHRIRNCTSCDTIPHGFAEDNHSCENEINIAAIVGGLCGIILLLLFIISLLVYFKVIKPTRNHPSAKKSDIRNEQDMTVSYAHYKDVTDSTRDSPTHDGAIEISRHTSNPYDDLSRYENQWVHEYGQIHLYESTESRVEPSQDNRTYTGLSNYVNHGDHHNYGEI